MPSDSRWPVLTATSLLLASVVLALVAQFVLSDWAEANQLHHQLQHGMLFFSGIGVGATGAALVRSGRRRAAEGPP